MPVAPGTRFGPYEVVAPLGAGGFGEVYKARDTRLDRFVAIKLLSELLSDPSARQRFEREARMASALNHPHIVSVFDVGEFEGRQYLVTELVEGGTLHDWTEKRPRTWRDVVELLGGVADALAAAHDAGILHRDVKPDNILIAANGYAKLADFGLAKAGDRDTATRALTEQRTRDGVVVGTVAYMSPEQAAGQPADARSDIYSFGLVLYETLAGHLPHGGPLPADAPPLLRAALEKALEKNPADRFQSVRELVVDLRRVLRQTGDVPASPLARPVGFGWFAAAIAVLALVGGLLGWRLSRARRADGDTPPRVEYTALTNLADSAVSPALSLDGRMLAFIRGQNTFFGPGEVWVKLLPDGDAVQLTHDGSTKMSPKFSPDGSSIAYTVGIGGGAELTFETWTVPVLGGAPRKLLANAEGLTWIPAAAGGQRRVLFSELTGNDAQMSIVTSTESRSNARTIYLPPPNGMAHRSFLSPDGKRILIVEMETAWLPCRVIPFEGASAWGSGTVVGPSPAQCTDGAWSPDGQWVYLTANTGNGFHTWRQRVAGGKPEQVTFGVTEEEGVDVAPDGKSFVTAIGTSQSTVWVHDARGDRQVTSEGYGFQPWISPDGTKVYYLVRTPSTTSFFAGELWVADLVSGQRQRLLPDFQLRHYTISADGRRVAFVAPDDKGAAPAWIAPLNGSAPPRRLAGGDCWFAFFGAAGDVIVQANEKGELVLYRVAENGGVPERLAAEIFAFGPSPDGRWIVGQSSKAWGALFAVSPDGSGETIICTSCSPPQGTDPQPPTLRWSPDAGTAFLTLPDATFAIPLKGGQTLPPTPKGGLKTKKDVAALPGAKLIADAPVYAGPAPSTYAFTKIASQRNIYRVRIR